MESSDVQLQAFIIHWLDGKKEIIHGYDFIDACRRAGIGNGCVPAIDYWDHYYEGD